MAISWTKTVEVPLMLEGMFNQRTMSQLLASGVLDPDTLAVTATGGDSVKVPRQPLAADFERTNIGSTSDLSPTHVSTKNDVAVVLRDHSINEVAKHDSIRTGADMSANLALSLGDKMAKRVCTMLFKGLIAAIQGLTTSHTVDSTSETAVTVGDIRKAKLRLGDYGDDLQTLIMPSEMWGDLLRDLIENYKIDTVGGVVVNNGKLQSVMGISNIIVSDLVPDDQFDISSDTVGPILLCGPNSLYFAFQRAMEIEYQKNILKPSTLEYIKASMDYVVSAKGSTFDAGVTNPTDAQFGSSGSWSQGATDHRECMYAMIVAKGGVYS